jgi:hypothetical protein
MLVGGPVANSNAVMVSPPLAAALDNFRRFVIADDAERSEAIEGSDREALTALADAVDPLFEEINSVLDRLVEKAHPLPDDEDILEYELNSLAQAAMEARQELAARPL